MRSIKWISALKNRLEAAEGCAIAFSIDNLLFAADSVNRNFYCHVSFDPGYGVNFYSGWHFMFLLNLMTGTFGQAGSRCYKIRVGLNLFHDHARDHFHHFALWKLGNFSCLFSNHWFRRRFPKRGPKRVLP
jgi:hypothetical protein